MARVSRSTNRLPARSRARSRASPSSSRAAAPGRATTCMSMTRWRVSRESCGRVSPATSTTSEPESRSRAASWPTRSSKSAASPPRSSASRRRGRTGLTRSIPRGCGRWAGTRSSSSPTGSASRSIGTGRTTRGGGCATPRLPPRTLGLLLLLVVWLRRRVAASVDDVGDLVDEPGVLLRVDGRVCLGHKPFAFAQGIDSLQGLPILGFADDQQVVVIPQYVQHHLDLPADQVHLLAQLRPLHFEDSRLAFGREDANGAGPKPDERHELHDSLTSSSAQCNTQKSTPSAGNFP